MPIRRLRQHIDTIFSSPLGPATGVARQDGVIRGGRLAGLTMNRAIFVLSWPVLVESLLNSLVGLTDTILAAGLGASQTDAIGGASYITWFLGLIIMSVGVGATALVSRSTGAGRRATANAAVTQSMLLSITAGSLGALLVFLLAPTLASLHNMNDEASLAFVSYMRVMALTVPSMAILFTGIACLRGAGDSMSPLRIMTMVNVVNILVSATLSGVDVLGVRNPSPFDLGISGIAWGTFIAQAFGALEVLRLLVRGRSGIRLPLHRIGLHRITMFRIGRVSLPNFAETAGLWFGNFVIIMMVGSMNRLEDGLLGVHVIAIRIEAFSFLPGFAMGTAAATLAGQYLGAGQPSLALRSVFRCALIAGGVMGLLGASMVLFPSQIVGLLSRQPIHLERVPLLIVIAGAVQVPFALAIVFRGALRGAGDVRVCMALTWITTYLVRLPMAYLFSGVDLSFPFGGRTITIENPSPLDWGLSGLWLALCLELCFRCVIYLARFVHGGWVKVRV